MKKLSFILLLFCVVACKKADVVPDVTTAIEGVYTGTGLQFYGSSTIYVPMPSSGYAAQFTLKRIDNTSMTFSRIETYNGSIDSSTFTVTIKVSDATNGIDTIYDSNGIVVGSAYYNQKSLQVTGKASNGVYYYISAKK